MFIVVPELAWALSRRELRAKAARAALAPAAAGVALLPLAITQAGGSRAAFIHSTSLASRVAAVPKQLLIGYATPGAAALTAVAAVLAVALAVGLRRKDAELAGLALAAVGVPVVLAVLGADYLITRNVIAAMVPLVVLGAVASTRLRAGPLIVAGICAAGAVAFVGVELTPSDQRDDWRAVAAQVGSLAVPRAVVLEPASGAPAFEIYAPMVPAPGNRGSHGERDRRRRAGLRRAARRHPGAVPGVRGELAARRRFRVHPLPGAGARRGELRSARDAGARAAPAVFVNQ